LSGGGTYYVFRWGTRLARVFLASGTRRGVLQRLGAVSLAGLAATLFGEAGGAEGRQHGRNRGHRPGKDKDNRKGQRTGNGVGDGSSNGPSALCLSTYYALQPVLDQLPAGSRLHLCAGTWQPMATILVNKDVTILGNINGGPSVLNGGDFVQVVGIRPNITVKFENVTFTQGNTDEGAGIFNQGDLTLTNCQVTGNFARLGGGIYNEGTLELYYGSITGNHVKSDSSFTPDYFGGGIYNDGGTVHVTGTTIADNIANYANSDNGAGGGIYNNGGTVTLQAGSSVSGNASVQNGGGLYDDGGSLAIAVSSIVTGNHPDNCYAYSGGPFANCVA
jgi:hypothetical protein